MLLVESHILPPVIEILVSIRLNGLVIESHENYQKRSFRNKFYISSANDNLLISVPLRKGKNTKKPISQVEISYDVDWIAKLIKTLKTSYGNAPFYKYYSDSLYSVFECRYHHLLDLNTHLLKWLISSMELNLRIHFTRSYQRKHDSTVLDWRNKGLSFYKNYRFDNQSYLAQIVGSKQSFICNLSSIDLLFNKGPETGLILRRAAEIQM